MLFMETKTFEWLESELNNASDERDDINNKLDRIIKHLNIKEEDSEELNDDINSDEDEFDL